LPPPPIILQKLRSLFPLTPSKDSTIRAQAKNTKNIITDLGS
jgi:hypothetical protein